LIEANFVAQFRSPIGSAPPLELVTRILTLPKLAALTVRLAANGVTPSAILTIQAEVIEASRWRIDPCEGEKQMSEKVEWKK
jgi:hypothetical protein